MQAKKVKVSVCRFLPFFGVFRRGAFLCTSKKQTLNFCSRVRAIVDHSVSLLSQSVALGKLRFRVWASVNVLARSLASKRPLLRFLHQAVERWNIESGVVIKFVRFANLIPLDAFFAREDASRASGHVHVCAQTRFSNFRDNHIEGKV